jgi:two-component system, chemotaxis family, chemotaxis protein CheY
MERSSERGLARVRVLIVDDNIHMTNITRTILRGFGIKEIFDASTAAAAFEFVRETSVDIIITDYAMEPVDGCKFTQLLRTAEDSPNHYVPIIMLTAYAEKSRVEAARDSGVTEFCAKPITPTDLYRKVCSVVNTPRSFVRTSVYFGPDRRRRRADAYVGEERREKLFGPKASAVLNAPPEPVS